MEATPKPRRYAEYAAVDQGMLERVCLQLATAMGGLMRTDLTVVGGYVPRLLVRQDGLAAADRHCGTTDIDLGLSLALLEGEQYEAIEKRLVASSFYADRNEQGNPTRQRWCAPGGPPVTVDFLIAGPDGGGLQNLTGELAAVRTPGLQLIARDFVIVQLTGTNLDGVTLTRDVRVCGPGAFVVLKARANRDRDEPKDALDMTYVLTHYEGGVEAVADRLRPLLDDPDAREAVAWLREDFGSIDSIGPLRVAVFLQAAGDDALQADAHGLVRRLLQLLD